MPKFQYVEAVYARRTVEVRAPNREAADKLYQKYGAEADHKDCRTVKVLFHDAFLVEVLDEKGVQLDYLLTETEAGSVAGANSDGVQTDQGM